MHFKLIKSLDNLLIKLIFTPISMKIFSSYHGHFTFHLTKKTRWLQDLIKKPLPVIELLVSCITLVV